MSSNATDEPDGRDASTAHADPNPDRYAELAIGDEEFIIYDRDNPRAWIQSSVTISSSDLQ